MNESCQKFFFNRISFFDCHIKTVPKIFHQPTHSKLKLKAKWKLWRIQGPHTTFLTYAFTPLTPGIWKKQQGTQYFPGSPPFGAHFLPVSGCQSQYFPSLLQEEHTHEYRPCGLISCLWCVVLFSCFPHYSHVCPFISKDHLESKYEYFRPNLTGMGLIIHFLVSLLNRGVLRQCLHGRERSMAFPLWPSRFWRKPTSVVVSVSLPPSSLPATIPCCSTSRSGTFYCLPFNDPYIISLCSWLASVFLKENYFDCRYSLFRASISSSKRQICLQWWRFIFSCVRRICC